MTSRTRPLTRRCAAASGGTALIVALAGCGSENPADGGLAAPSATQPTDSDVNVRVIPADQRLASGAVRSLPQSFGPFSERLLIAGGLELALVPPVRLSGSVIGEEVTPYAALGGLPTVTSPVGGRVMLIERDGPGAYDVATDPVTGRFEVDVIPAIYELAAVPDSTRLAPHWAITSVTSPSNAEDVVLSEGQALYGKVSTDGGPFANCGVYAVDSFGHETALALTDADGRYEIRVPPGEWSVVTLGGQAGLDPAIESDPVELDESSGAAVDVAYPALKRLAVSLDVVADGGGAIDAITVRFTAVTLDGYGDQDASLVVEARSFEGHVDLQLSPGVWQLEMLPGDGAWSGSRASETYEIRDNRDLGEFPLSPLVQETGQVLDAAGGPLGDARIACTEIGFAGRSWTTLSSPSGAWTLPLPTTGAHCSILPPGTRTDLAAIRQDIAPNDLPNWAVNLPVGAQVHGAVTFDGVAEPFAVVEVTDGTGAILATGLTDTGGRFVVALPPLQ